MLLLTPNPMFSATCCGLREQGLDRHMLSGIFAFPFRLGDFPGGLDGKASAYNAGDPGSISVSGRSPGEGNGNPLQHSCLENHGQRSLADCSPWSCKGLDMTERLTTQQQQEHRLT